jgi:hypothetical protein
MAQYAPDDCRSKPRPKRALNLGVTMSPQGHYIPSTVFTGENRHTRRAKGKKPDAPITK